MHIAYIILFFILGATVGSFYNVVGLRVPKGETITEGRSHCTTCDRTLSWYELIPVLSWLIQGGKCRGCKETISPIYPAFELLTGFLFALSYILIGFQIELVVALLFMSMLVIITVSDLKYMLIPNKILMFFVIPLFIARAFTFSASNTFIEMSWWSPIVGAVIGFLTIMVIILVSNGGMGAGDMKLFFVIGLVLGWQLTVLALLLSFLTGAVLGVTLMVFGIVKRKQPFPFGPSIVIATIVTYFYGTHIIDWYLGFM